MVHITPNVKKQITDNRYVKNHDKSRKMRYILHYRDYGESLASFVRWMMRPFWVICGTVLALSSIAAMGRGEAVETSAASLDSWLETIDISGAKPGKYNILVTATDLAGNQALAGPYNLYVDPDSDLPVARITNPLSGIRVPGNLNVVGTCLDDDAVDHVELIFDGGEPVRAEGTDFWSYYLDTNDLVEGPHIISVYGVDVNGIAGKPFTAVWHLDRKQPETEVGNLAMGTLVSGKVNLSGTVFDGNGIKNLAYSLDAGKTFLPLSLKFDKKDRIWRFSLPINTLKFDDGPSVCWFRAEDAQGSIGYYTYLYFVDNTKPMVNFIAPLNETAVNGAFSVSGTASDTIGLASLSWRIGKETGEFELVKGNPYWIKEFDVTGLNAKNVEVFISATDIAGNVTTVSRKIPIDQKADLPVLSINSPAADSVADSMADSGQHTQSGEVWLSGSVADDDGVAAVRFSVDKGEVQEIDSSGAYGVTLAGLAPGRHTVTCTPVDIYGIAGLPVTRTFLISGTAPVVTFQPVSDPAREISPEAGAVLTATVEAPAGLAALSWQVAGMGEQTVKIKPGITSQTITVPVTPNFPYGLGRLEVTATDTFSRTVKGGTEFYVTNLSVPRDAAPEWSDDALTASAEVTIPASGKVPASSGTATVTLERLLPADRAFTNGALVTLAGPAYPKAEQIDGAVIVGIDSPISITSIEWTLNGGTAAKASAQKTPEGRYEARIPLKALLAADWTTLNVTVTFKDLTALSVSGSFCVVRPESTAGMNDGEAFAWDSPIRDGSEKILLHDGAAVSGLYNGKPDRQAVSAALSAADTASIDGLELRLSGNEATISGLKDGTYKDVKIAFTDDAGETWESDAETFVVDSGLPNLTVDTSSRPVWLQNALPVTVGAADNAGIAAVEWTVDGGATWNLFDNPDGATLVSLDISSLSDGPVDFIVRATDINGREKTDRRAFNKDTAPPEIPVLFPEPGDAVNGETGIAFDPVDASPVVQAEYRAPGDRTEADTTVWQPLDLSSAVNVLIGTADKPLDPSMEFRFTDAAGNSATVNSWLFTIEPQTDLPTVEIHLPADNEVIRKDFVVSGVVYDDDAPAKIWYKVDDGEFAEVDIEHSYSIPIALSSLTDNEHTITLYAEDIHGVKGEEVSRTVRVSLEEPKAAVLAPSFETTNRGVLTVSGIASDKNGIERVEVSLDNGNSFNRAEGTDEWSYSFDTRVIQDGTHVVFVRVYDNYEITGLYSSLINIDNTAPSIKLELPLDGSRVANTLFISGQTLDNINLSGVTARISGLDAKQPAMPAGYDNIGFEDSLIIAGGIDVAALTEGFYNVEVRGTDLAGNVTRVSRNFEVYRGEDRNRIEFLYPLNGERMQGLFNLYGRVISEDTVSSLILYVDDADAGTAELSPSGYFKFTLSPENVTDGTHVIKVRALAAGDSVIVSDPHEIIYAASGPWVTIDNLAMGDFAIDRPWLEGTAGYALSEEEVFALKAKDTDKETKRALQDKAVSKVEISFDNGKTFTATESGKKWRYRLETGELSEGYHFILLRATMKNGETAVTRSIVQIDKTLPTIRLISPGEGGRYNNELVFSGLSSDDVRLDNVNLALRPGDKSSYALPSFIQGLYFDWHFWGATLYDVGVGLTFFDDNVKLQGQFGQFTDAQRAVFTEGAMRYGGNVLGIKLLANIAFVPLDYFFGPDFSWLSATGAIGANFSMFTETQSGTPQILSAMLVQLEFPRVTIPKRTTFRTFSAYTEAQLWFIPTDVNSTEVNINSMIPHITGGIRLSVF